MRKIYGRSNRVVKMSLKILSGRKRGNAVWSHFKYESSAVFGVNEGKLCVRLVTGKNTTNPPSHLKYHHPFTLHTKKSTLRAESDIYEWVYRRKLDKT